ncbi:MAG: hypothetical protein ABEJ68_02915 [Halobacteriaceae archaeon]
MEFRTRVALGAVTAVAAVVAGFVTLGPAPRLALFLTLIVLAYAYGPTVWNGVPSN